MSVLNLVVRRHSTLTTRPLMGWAIGSSPVPEAPLCRLPTQLRDVLAKGETGGALVARQVPGLRRGVESTPHGRSRQRLQTGPSQLTPTGAPVGPVLPWHCLPLLECALRLCSLASAQAAIVAHPAVALRLQAVLAGATGCHVAWPRVLAHLSGAGTPCAGRSTTCCDVLVQLRTHVCLRS